MTKPNDVTKLTPRVKALLERLAKIRIRIRSSQDESAKNDVKANKPK